MKTEYKNDILTFTQRTIFIKGKISQQVLRSVYKKLKWHPLSAADDSYAMIYGFGLLADVLPFNTERFVLPDWHLQEQRGGNDMERKL